MSPALACHSCRLSIGHKDWVTKVVEGQVAHMCYQCGGKLTSWDWEPQTADRKLLVKISELISSTVDDPEELPITILDMINEHLGAEEGRTAS